MDLLLTKTRKLYVAWFYILKIGYKAVGRFLSKNRTSRDHQVLVL